MKTNYSPCVKTQNPEITLKNPQKEDKKKSPPLENPRPLLADSHTHVLSERIADRADEIARNLREDGLEFIVEVGTGIMESRRNFEFALRHDNVYCTIGVHPHYASEFVLEVGHSSLRGAPRYLGTYPREFEELVKISVAEDVERERQGLVRKTVAIGECGLDYHYDNSPRACQRDAFIAQIKLAHEVKLPLVIHSRDAFEDTFEILKEYKELLTNGVLFHCYGYGAEEAKLLIKEFDAYFAFGGAITFVDKEFCRKNGYSTAPLNNVTKHICQNSLQEALHVVPLDRLILETDCPYLAPAPMRGKINEPKNLRYIAGFVADRLETNFERVAELTLANTKNFFRIN